MISLDHTILRVRDCTESVSFYRDILGLRHEGRAGPFEVMRVHAGLTLDLMQRAPNDQVHLAFCVDRQMFDEIRSRLVQHQIPFGGEAFERDGRVSANPFGAAGMADALYFYDPSQHNLEIRTYLERT